MSRSNGKVYVNQMTVMQLFITWISTFQDD